MTCMNRFRFPATAALLATALFLATTALGGEGTGQKPNIVFILADDK